MKFTLKEIFEDFEVKENSLNEVGTETYTLKNQNLAKRKGSVKYVNSLKTTKKEVEQLMNTYKLADTFSKHEQMKQTLRELVAVFEHKVKVSSREIYRYGAELERRADYFAAVLFYQLSAEHSKKHMIPDEAVILMADCISKILGAALNFEDEEHLNLLVIMNDLLESLRSMEQSSDKLLSLNEARSLRVIGIFQGLLGLYAEEEESLKKAIYVVENILGKKSHRYKTYSGCLFSLATSYKHEQQRKQSIMISNEFKVAMSEMVDSRNIRTN